MKKIIILMLSVVFSFAEITKLQIKEAPELSIYADCDQVIHDPNQVKCYNYKFRESIFNFYYIPKGTADSNNIKKKFSFKVDKRIPEKYRYSLKCYVKSGYDRGHLYPDATADYNETVLKSTFLTTNILPEVPYVNRHVWAKIENIIREYSNTKDLYVLVGGQFLSKNRLKKSPNCPGIPDYIYAIIFEKKQNKFEPIIIFRVKNKSKDDKDYEIETLSPNQIFFNIIYK